MKIKILYFAELRDAVGMSEEDVDTDAPDIESLAAVLVGKHPPLGARLASIRFARNEAFARAADKLSPDDVIALLPPVAGG